MRVLFITKHDPFSDGGGSFATHSYLKAFSMICNGNIDICIADICEPFQKTEIPYRHLYRVKQRPLYARLMSIFTGEMQRYSHFVKNLLKENSNEYTYCVFDHNSVGGTLVRYANQMNIRTITIHHNYEPEFLLSNEENIIKRWLLYPQVRRIEKIAYKYSTMNFFLTTDDETRFLQEYGRATGVNNIIGCFESSDILPPIPQKKIDNFTFIITGSLSAVETKKAIQNFFKELYSFLPRNSTIIIAGKEASQKTIELCKKYPNVKLVNSPPNMKEIVKQADIYICPNHTGGGLKLRIMDGLRNGLPVIANQMAARGYEQFIGYKALSTYQTPDEFNKCVNSIISNPISKKDIQLIYHNLFSFSAGVERLKNIIQI